MNLNKHIRKASKILITNKIVVVMLIMSLFIVCCHSIKYGKIVDAYLKVGYQSCINEMLKLADQKILDEYFTYVESFPNGVDQYGTDYLLKKKLKKTPTKYYSHKFKFRYDSLITYDFILATDITGQFSAEYNSKHRDYLWLVEYFKLLNSTIEFEQLMNSGVEYFGDNRFTISFSNRRVVAYQRKANFTKQEIVDIRKNKLMYELIDRDFTRDKENREYVNRGIIIDPNTKKIINEVTIIHQYVY